MHAKKSFAYSSGRPGGLLWLLKWIVLVALVLVLLMLTAPETAFAGQPDG